MAEAAIAYHTQADTDGAEILDRFRAIIEERDTLRTKCAKQGRVITKLADLMGELQEFIEEGRQDGEPSAPAAAVEAVTTPTPVVVAAHTGVRRYTDEDALHWAEMLRGGKSQVEIGKQIGVSTRTINKRLTDLGYDPATGFPRAPQAIAQVELAPAPATVEDAAIAAPAEITPSATPLEATASNAPSYDDDTIAAWVRALDSEHTTVEEIAEHVDENPYLVRGLVRGWREEHGVTVKED